MLTRLALYCTLALVLNALGQDVASTGFWLIVALFWASEHLTRAEVINDISKEVERIKRERKDQQ